MTALTSKPARTDLTDRECTKIIGGVLGGLVEMAEIETIRAAVRWWAESDQAWEMLRVWQNAMRKTPINGAMQKFTQ